MVEFTGLDGQLTQLRTRNGSTPAPARRGDHVHVLIDPLDPGRVFIDLPEWAFRGEPILLRFVAVLAVGSGVGMLAFGVLGLWLGPG